MKLDDLKARLHRGRIGKDGVRRAPEKVKREAATAVTDLEALVGELGEALVQHNECLRSAQQIAQRDGKDTNWLAFRGQCTWTLAEYHDLVNKARATLAKLEARGKDQTDVG